MNTKNLDYAIVTYSSFEMTPKIINISFSSVEDFLKNAPVITLENLKEQGSEIPPIAIIEALQNLIHADFSLPIASILHNGNTLRISDQGKGIKDKDKCVLPGFTTASYEMRKFIRGIGAGFSIIKESLKSKGGSFTIDDNLGGGVVLTLSMLTFLSSDENLYSDNNKDIHLTERQKKVLLLFSEIGQVGPSSISNELNIPIATAFRDIKHLEKNNLVKMSSAGKRFLTQKGIKYLQDIV